MKRSWAITAVVAVLSGCAQTQPATNPFLRTTVAPPATGQGAVVMPPGGDAYAPTITQGTPMAPITQAPPIGQPAAVPMTTPVAPIGQPMAAPPAIAPPIVPPKDKYSPPGGSYQYNQSSLERRGAAALAATSVSASDGANRAVAIAAQDRQASRVVTASYAEPVAATLEDDEQAAEDDLSPPQLPSSAPANTVRIAENAGDATVDSANDVLLPSIAKIRMTAGPSAEQDELAGTADSGAVADNAVRVVSADAESVEGTQSAAGDEDGAEAAVVHTVQRPLSFGPLELASASTTVSTPITENQSESWQNWRSRKLRYIPTGTPNGPSRNAWHAATAIACRSPTLDALDR